MLPMALWAQDNPKLTVSGKRQVVVGERFQVVFEVNAEGRDFKAPSFGGLNKVGGPSTSTSTSFQSINGSVTQSVKYSYTYFLQADKEGTFTIGPASVTVNGNKVTSEPFEVKVSPDNGSHASPSSGGGTSSNQNQLENTKDPNVSGKDLFIKCIPSKKSAYVGEQIVLTFKLYVKSGYGVSQVSNSKMPSFGGFWTKDISDNSGVLKQDREYINGVEYATAVISKMILVPQRAGKFTIDPMKIECIAQIPVERQRSAYRDPFEAFFDDSFFFPSYTNVQKELSSQSLGLEVKALPENGKPASFAGAVGDYKFTSSIDKMELNTNEAVTLTLTVSGTGNIELLQMPEPVFPTDFEVYDPKVSLSTSVTSQGLKGTKTAEYLAIPRHAGNFTIPPVEFSYFDPGKASYQTITSEPYELTVHKGKDSEQEGGPYVANQETIKKLGDDIRHIMNDGAHLKPKNATFFASPTYFAILLGLVVVLAILLLVLKKHAEMVKDTAANRNRKADRVARGRLKNAYKHLKAKDQEKFYVEMSQALWGYIADKLGIERSKLSMETVSETMQGKNVPDELTQQFVDTLNSCEFARFAPGSAEEKMDDLYQRGIDVISKAEKVL